MRLRTMFALGLGTAVLAAATLLGAGCFLIGAALMFPAWRQALLAERPAVGGQHP